MLNELPNVLQIALGVFLGVIAVPVAALIASVAWALFRD